jgi:hypothetical protein
MSERITAAVAPAAPAPAPVDAPANPITPAAPEAVGPADGGGQGNAETEISPSVTALPERTPSMLEDDPEPEPIAEAEKPADAVVYAEFKLPDGFTPDDAALQAFSTLASELALPQDGAQRLVDLYAQKVADIVAAPLRQWNDTQAAWKAEINAMPEFQGSLLKDAKKGIVRALDAHPNGPNLKSALEFTGAINNPHVWRFMNEWAHANSERPLVPAERPAVPQKTPGERVYGGRD